MTDQEIIENAPKGATHIDVEYDFCKDGYFFDYPSKQWIPSEFIVESRALTDIRRIAELEKERIKLLRCLLDISNECIGEITMNYRVDSEYIGGRIQATTGMTRSQLGDAVKGRGK